MSQNGNGSSAGTKQFVLHQLYIKDLSFEAPNSPEVLKSLDADADTQMNIKNSHRDLGDGRFEVILHLSIHTQRGDKTVFLLELDQGGVFEIGGFNEAEIQQLIGTHCPATLFPYARETVSSTIIKGGFPALVLQPINFEALYAQSQQSGNAKPN